MTSPLVHQVSEWISSAHLEKLFGSTAEEKEEDEGTGSDDEEQEDVDELLWASQMCFVSHDSAAAVLKLEQAVALRSSAACATLAHLLLKSLRSAKHASSPPIHPAGTHPRPHPGPVPHDSESMSAARLFVMGLDYELAKGHHLPGRKRRGSKPAGSYGRSGSLDSASSDTEGDSVEGKYLNLERVLDLVVGLTDCYRYGVLQPSQEGSLEPSDRLWNRGGAMAERALQHPAINDAPLPSPSPNPVAQPTFPPPISTPPLDIPETPGIEDGPQLSSSNPRRNAVARSYTHPAHQIASPLNFNYVPPHTNSTSVSHHLPAHLKHRLTIQIHLYYLLALQKWPTDKALAEKYWTEILRVAASTGGAVGTKEGNEIVAKATRRLNSLHTPDDGWKLAKRRKGRGESDHIVIVPTVQNLEIKKHDGFLGRRNRRKSGDALVEMRREQEEEGMRLGNGRRLSIKGKGKQREIEGDQDDFASSAITIVPNKFSPPATGAGQSFGNSLKSSDATPRASSMGITPSPKPSKFHFATNADYPSPPETPSSSPPLPSEEPEPVAALDSSSSKRLRRVTSTSSFRPPRLLPRVQSSASVSTLPPDFFSAHSRTIGPNWSSTTAATTGSSLAFDKSLGLEDRSASAGPATGWAGNLRHRFATLRSNSTRVASSLNPFRYEPPKVSAASFLKDVLEKDDRSAGPGMYWAIEGDEDELETDHEEGDEHLPPGILDTPPQGGAGLPLPQEQQPRRVTTPTFVNESARAPRPLATKRRSFQDPTSRVKNAPAMVFTPPTPDKGGASAVTSTSTAPPSISGIDPLLEELERKSRVGTRTKCLTCGRKGLNFPACPRCKNTYCSRECRISEDGGGDGSRHVCPD